MRKARGPDRRSARRFRHLRRAVASGWASSRPSRKDATAGNGWPIFTSRRGRRLPMPAGMRLTSTSSGSAANSRCRQRPMTAAFCAPSATIPLNNKLPTPSGKIEIHSNTIAGFGYDDCPGHPAWLPSTEPPDVAPPVDADRQPAGDPAAQPARFRCLQPVAERSPAAKLSVSTPSMRRTAASPMATSSACSMIAARAWLPPPLPTTSCPACCNYPPAPGTIRSLGRQNIRSASMAIRTCSPATSAHRGWRKAAAVR